MTLVLDSGALIALDRDERAMWTRLKAAQVMGDVPVTHAGVLGQVWRGDPRQARLARALRGIDIRSIDERLGRAAGACSAQPTCPMSSTLRSCCAIDRDDIVTWDPGDMSRRPPPQVGTSS